LYYNPGMAKNKGGRPELDEDEKLAEIIQFRLTAEERRLCEEAAEQKGFKKLSKWIREQLLKAAKRQT
jgi:uncharacterized protein (DUF1778 family)